MYLHREDRELFHDIILAVSEKSGLDENIVEKDYLYTYIKDTDYDIIAKFGLIPFEMKAQSLVRTFIDKLFAVCDYYLEIIQNIF